MRETEEGTVGVMLVPMLKMMMESLNIKEEDLQEWAKQGGEERQSLLSKMGIDENKEVL